MCLPCAQVAEASNEALSYAGELQQLMQAAAAPSPSNNTNATGTASSSGTSTAAVPATATFLMLLASPKQALDQAQAESQSLQEHVRDALGALEGFASQAGSAGHQGGSAGICCFAV